MEHSEHEKYEIIHQNEERAGNATLIWRKQGEPIAPSGSTGDRRFLRHALAGSAIALALLVLVGYIAYRNAGTLKIAYSNFLIIQGQYQTAKKLILSIDSPEEQEKLLDKNNFMCAQDYEKQGRLSEAVELYRAANNYPGADEAFLHAGYELAKIYEADGDNREAGEAYAELGDYLDAVERGDVCRYAYAQECFDNGDYEEAMRLFYALGSYEDAETYAKKSAAALSENEGAGDLVSLLVGLTDEQLEKRAQLKTERESLPVGIVATGYQHTVARTEAGTVLATGSNLLGQCNVSEWTDIVQVAAGAYHTVGLHADGTVVATGMNEYGQCDVTKWQNVVAVFAGAYNTVAITSGGRILNTGYQKWDTLTWRETSQLSVGDYALCGVMQNGQPLSSHAEMTTDEYYDLVALDAATANSAGLKADGTVVSNGLDVTGLNDIVAIDCTPNGVYALDDLGYVHARNFSYAHLPDVSDWKNIIAISASATHIAGVTSDGRVYSRGLSDMGQCDTQEWVLFTPNTESNADAGMIPESNAEE